MLQKKEQGKTQEQLNEGEKQPTRQRIQDIDSEDDPRYGEESGVMDQEDNRNV